MTDRSKRLEEITCGWRKDGDAVGFGPGEAREQINFLLDELKKAWKQNEELVEALEKVDGYWFDESVMKQTACYTCDLGYAGGKRKSDGHDEDCPLAITHDALAKFNGENLPDKPIEALVKLAKTTPPKNEHGT